MVGRQPIFDRKQAVLGYELLFRSTPLPRDPADRLDDTYMTADVILGSVSIGLDRLVGPKKVFCNAERDVLIGDLPLVLPPTRTVLEILETVVVDDDVVAGCQRLVDAGYGLALDDFVWAPGVERLLELASIVKIDIQAVDLAGQRELIERARAFDVKIVAEKVETRDELQASVDLGYDYFQGFLLSRPQVVPGRTLDPNRGARLRLASKLFDTECSIEEIEAIVRTDPAMVHQLLKMAALGMPGGTRRVVKTLRQALVVVGWRRLQSWVALLLVVTGDDPGSEEQMVTSLIRARMCEVLAERLDRATSGMAFAAGILSSLDLLLQLPLPTVLSGLPLDEELRRSVIGHHGPLGNLLADVIDYQFDLVDTPRRCAFDDSTLHRAYLASLAWAVDITSTFAS